MYPWLSLFRTTGKEYGKAREVKSNYLTVMSYKWVYRLSVALDILYNHNYSININKIVRKTECIYQRAIYTYSFTDVKINKTPSTQVC